MIPQGKDFFDAVSVLISADIGLPGWRGYRYTWIDNTDLLEIKGCIPAGVYTRGPRKGQVRWRHPSNAHTQCTVTMSRSEIDRRLAAMEAKT